MPIIYLTYIYLMCVTLLHIIHIIYVKHINFKTLQIIQKYCIQMHNKEMLLII